MPFSISTDLHVQNVSGLVWDLATTISKLMNLGLPLGEVIQCVTAHPAAFLGLEGYSRIAVGYKAHLTLFHLREAEVTMPDANGHHRLLSTLINPYLVVRGMQVQKAGSRHPALAAGPGKDRGTALRPDFRRI